MSGVSLWATPGTAHYLGDSVLVNWRNNALFAPTFDLSRLEVGGPHNCEDAQADERTNDPVVARLLSWNEASSRKRYNLARSAGSHLA